MKKVIIGIVIGILVVAIIAILKMNKPQAVIQNNNNNETQEQNHQEIPKPQISKAIKGEYKNRRCRFNNEKYRKPCTQKQFNEWQNQMDFERKEKQRKKKEEELAKLYSPDEYIDYENKIIQPYAIIDEDNVGWNKKDVKERKRKNFIINNYDSINFNTKKFIHNIKEKNINIISLQKPSSRTTWNYEFKEMSRVSGAGSNRVSIYLKDPLPRGGRTNLIYDPDKDTLTGMFTNRGNVHFIEVKNNKGYVYNVYK
jgi:hypothetical protein